jgi:DNA-binding XRE family transcriptional regulator
MQNHLRAHRRRCGLSQRDLAQLVGYLGEWQISRHEQSGAMPPLHVALAYEAILEVPASKLFRGLYATITKDVSRNIARMRQESKNFIPAQDDRTALRKFQWLAQYKTE